MLMGSMPGAHAGTTRKGTNTAMMTYPHECYLRGEQPMNMFPPSPVLPMSLFERFAQ
jgi:hypothetical protein